MSLPLKTGIPSLVLVLLLALSNVRIVSAQPSVQTLPATSITDTSAQLNGNLNTNGQDTDWAFKVLDSSGNEIQTVCSSAWNAGSVGQSSVNCPVNSLQPSTTYGFALIAIWHGGNGGWQYGNIVSFTTLASGLGASGPGSETDAATGLTDTSAVLNGVVTTNGQDTFWMFTVRDANGAFVQNCPSGNLQFVPANVGTQPVSCQANQLQSMTAYYFVLQSCWQPAGTCVYGSTLSFTTLAAIYTNILTIAKSSTTSQPTGPAFDFTMTVTPVSVSVAQGGTAYYVVQVQYSDPSYSGTVINLQLMGLGPGMNWQVTQAGDLMITTTPTTPTGSYAVSMTGSANGVTHQTGMTLIVTSAAAATTAVTTTTKVSTTSSSVPFDFSVTVSPSTQSIEIGGKTSYIVSVLPLSGSPVLVSLTVMGCPSDIGSSFTVPSGSPPYTSTLNLDLSSSSDNAGAYTLTVVGTAGGNVKTATATLVIQPKATQTTTSQTTTTAGSSWLDVLQQNSLIIAAALIALAVVLGVFALRGRRQHRVPQPTGSTGIFCSECGTGNPASNEFCRNCGSKLKSSQTSEAS